MQYNGTTDSTLFEFWFEKCLLPCLKEETTIVMDNASFHRKEYLLSIAQKNNFKLIFLPPYSPELNPIENFWFVLKHRIKMHIPLCSSLNDAVSLAFS